MSEQKHKARNPVQKRAIETKKKILLAAETLFVEKGYHKTNAMEIATRAGVATGSFYGYFNNKKEVMIEMIRGFYDTTIEKVLNAYKVQEPGTTTDNYREGKRLIHYMIEALYAAHDVDPVLHREFIAMALLDKEIGDINREEERKVIAAMTSFLHAYRDFIRVKDNEATAELLYRVSEEIIHRIRIMGTDIDSGRLLAELEEMVCRYLLQPDGN